MHRTRAAIAAVVLVGLVWTGPLAADLEVGVPPGSPHDWTLGYPQPALTGIDRVPTGRVGQGSVEVTPWTRDAFQSASSIFDFSGITTRDLPIELPWTRPELTKNDKPDVELTGTDRAGRPTLRYPPAVSDYMHWLAMATLLRTVMHPAQVSELASREHLTLLGTPAWLAARRAAQEEALEALANDLMKRIRTPPGRRPERPRAKDPYLDMLCRLAWVELSSGVPYEPGRPFAPKLRWVGIEGLSAVLQCSQSRHVLLRRNATTLLGKYPGPAVSARLRALARDRDLVVRNRALAAIGERGDKAAVELLLELARSSDLGLAIQAIEALGRIGDGRAARPLVEILHRRDKSVDVWWAVLPAVARLAPKGDRQLVGQLAKIVGMLERDTDRFEPSKAEQRRYARIRADNPDPMTRTEATRQLGVIALAACGHAPARELIPKMIAGKDPGQQRDAAKEQQIADLQAKLNGIRQQMVPLQQQMIAAPPAERQQLMARLRLLTNQWRQVYTQLRQLDPTYVFRRQVMSGIVLKHVTVAGRYTLCDVLATLGKPGHEVLWRVIGDASESAQLRAHAFARFDASVPFGFVESFDKLTALATAADTPGLIATKALARLEKADPEAAVEAAKKVVGIYLDAADELPSLKHWAVIDALRLLGRRGKAATADVLRVVERAETEQRTAAQRREEHRKQLPKMRGRMYQIDLKVFTVPPVLEASLLELGRIGDAAARRALEDRLGDTKALGRPHAALALGGIQAPGVAARLVALLDDLDPFVRLMSYRALRRRSGKDFATDWIYATDQQRAPTVKRWAEWLKGLPEGR